jgi:phospho-N-acetylmuramoyl-pentapeptide-transferase
MNINEIIIYVICTALMIFIITLIIKYKKYFVSQKAREFLTMGEHQFKQMTPSMGGISFYAILPYLYYKYAGGCQFWFIAITTSLSGLIGGIDDWYKINRGFGLTVKIKFLLQMASSLLSGFFYYYFFPLDLYINFFGLSIDLGIVYILWVALVIMSTTHAVNLIDGIDGLAIFQLFTITVFFLVMTQSNIHWFWYIFWLFNRNKAKIFMGDIGAFFLGGYLSSTFILKKCEILLLVAGIVLVINTVMIILQLLYYKIYNKRLFSFTPYHHALEKKGWSEDKICLVYSCFTMFGSLISYFLYKKYF